MEQKRKRKAFTVLLCLLTVTALTFSACTEGSNNVVPSSETEESSTPSQQASQDLTETSDGVSDEASAETSDSSIGDESEALNSATSEEDETTSSPDSASETESEEESSEEPAGEPDESEENSHTSAEESNETSAEESSEEPSDSPSKETPEESSKETDRPAEDSPKLNGELREVTKQIAELDGKGVNTNIKAEEGSRTAEILAELEDYLSEQSDLGLCFVDATGEFYYAYNAGEKFSTASTIKLPYARYLLGLADKGEIDLSEEMTYTKDYYNSGSGRIKNMKEGTTFTVKKLIQYAVKYSDNIAYTMLLSRYGTKDFNKHLAETGVDFSISSTGYGSCTVAEMTALFFDFYHYEGKNKEFLKETLLNTSYNAQIGAGIKDYPVAQKFGCQISPEPSRRIYHDMAVVYAPKPFALGIFTRLDWNSSKKNVPFVKLASLINELNEELSK